VQQESSGNLVPALGGKNLAARKLKEKETGQHAGAKKTQAANGDFPTEEQSTRSKTQILIHGQLNKKQSDFFIEIKQVLYNHGCHRHPP
jgi:hypothetical protein